MKIVIATGGSGGHILPALYVAEELKKRGHEVRFVGVFSTLKQTVDGYGYAMTELPAKGLYTDSLKTILDSVCSMLKSVARAVKILREINPNAVIGFGGFGAFPVVMAAVLLKYPNMIHEQNVSPGRANYLLGKFVDKIAVSFEESRKHFSKRKTIFTGCPCHRKKEHYDDNLIEKEFRLKKGVFTILVLGGSQGCRTINRLFSQSLPELEKRFGRDFQVIHLSGEKDHDELKEVYGKSHVPYFLRPFWNEMDKAYMSANLVISRAGAVTITEIAEFLLPAIVIPYPLARGHQQANADALARQQRTEILAEAGLTAEKLTESILMCADAQDRNNFLFEGGLKIYQPNAAVRLAEEITRLGS